MSNLPNNNQKQNEVAIRQQPQQQIGSYIPSQQDWNFMLQWGQQAIKSKMLPTAISSPEAAAIIILKGRELGLSFMVSVAHIHIINGKPSMSAELMQAQARKNLPGLLINILESSSEKASVEFKRPEPGSKPFTLTFTMEDAKRADLLKNPTWQKYPRAMLWSRAVSAGLRIVCPEALMGVSYTPEELGADVNENGDVIETTGRKVDNQNNNTPPKPSEEPKPIAKPEVQVPNGAKEISKKIKELKLELGLTDDELRAQAHRIGLPEFTSMTLEQMNRILQLLEDEKAARVATSNAPSMEPREQADWEKEV